MTEKSLKRRAYLEAMGNYLEALIRKNLTMVPLAEDCLITFNGKRCGLGQNDLWANVLNIPQRQVFVDVVSGNVLLFGVGNNEYTTAFQGFPRPLTPEDGAVKPNYTDPFHALIVICLHLTDGKIDEIEEIFVRDHILRVNHSDIRLPELIFDIPIPEDERMTREELLEVTDTYWACIAKERPAEDLPLHPECRRVENGMCCTHNCGTFRGEFKNPHFTWNTPAALRRTPIIDETRGVVFSAQQFVEIEGVSDPWNPNPYILDLFKIENGLIRHIMAFWSRAAVPPANC